MKTYKRAVGDIGEDIVCSYLLNNNYSILERNYLKKWGELDIIAENEDIIHFIEVKSKSLLSVSRETLDNAIAKEFTIHVSHETDDFQYNPEENVHFWKKNRISRAIKTFLLERKIPDEKEFEIDVIVCIIDFVKRKANIHIIDNIMLE